MTEFNGEMDVLGDFSYEETMQECLNDVFVDGDTGEIVGTSSEGNDNVKAELESQFGHSSSGSEQVRDNVSGIVGSMGDPMHLPMDAVHRLDQSFFSCGVSGSEGGNPLPEEDLVSEVKAGSEVSGRTQGTNISIMNGVFEGNNLAAELVYDIVHPKIESLEQRDGVTKEGLASVNIDDVNKEILRDIPAGEEVAAIEETTNFSEDKVSADHVDSTDTVGNVFVTDEKESADFKECSLDKETQFMEIDQEFPLLEVDDDATVENGKEKLTSEAQAEVNGVNCLQNDEKLETATVKNADVEPVCGHDQLESLLVDTEEIFQISADNSSRESISVSEVDGESKLGTSGDTSIDDYSASIDSSPVEDQSISLDTKTQNLDDQMVTSIPTATPVSNAVNFDEAVSIEETTESYEHVGQNPQRTVNKNYAHDRGVDACISMVKDKEFVKEHVLGEVESHMMSDAEFSEYYDGSTNANLDLYMEAEVDETYNVEELEAQVNQQIPEVELGNEVEVKVSKATASRPRVEVDLATHLLPEERESGFSVSDLVWGKVKSHPWWPGQICDPEDASEKALKHQKKDCFLVAYFGDRTFGWNEGSVLKPFWSNFSQIEKQNNSEVIRKAINSALDEVSRRIMLGLSCFCVPNVIYSKVKHQIVENTGIREESSRRNGLDELTKASFLIPNKLIEYVRALAEFPSAGTDRLGLVIAKAQLLAFNQMRGYNSLPAFEYCGELLESDDIDDSILDQADECPPNVYSNKKLASEKRNSFKRKHNLTEGSYSSKREKRLSELMGDGGSDKQISFYAAKVSSTISPIPKPSFKVGDCIHRAASQLAGTLSVQKDGSDKLQEVNEIFDLPTPDNADTSPVENSSLDNTLLQLQVLARDPVKGHSKSGITNIFSGFRDSIHLSQHVEKVSCSNEKSVVGRKRKVSYASPEEFDDVGDSYWTGMIVENRTEGQPLGLRSNEQYKVVTLGAEKSNISSGKGNTKKTFSDAGNHEMDLDDRDRHRNEIRQANLPVELILNFPNADSIPSGIHLTKTFRRFGTLKEAETEIHPESCRARVVFKRCSDAEVAFNSSRRFSIFGPVVVKYELNYSPSVSLGTFPFATPAGLDEAA